MSSFSVEAPPETDTREIIDDNGRTDDGLTYNLMGDFRSGSLAANVGSEGTNPNSDPNGAAHYTTDHNAWLEFGGFFINTVSNGTATGVWSTANPGGSTGGGGGGTLVVPHPDLSAAYHAAIDVTVCGLGLSLAWASVAYGMAPVVPAALAGTLVCAQAIQSDADNLATALGEMFDAMESWTSQTSNNDLATSYFADYGNTMVQGSSSTGSETINTPDGSTYSGNDTGGFGESDSFKDLNAGPNIVVYYGDLPFVSHHSESPFISHL
jgi:hypothetical protein